MSSFEDKEKKRRRIRNHVVKDLHSRKYRQRVKGSKRHVQQVPDWKSINLDDNDDYDVSFNGDLIETPRETKNTKQ